MRSLCSFSIVEIKKEINQLSRREINDYPFEQNVFSYWYQK